MTAHYVPPKSQYDSSVDKIKQILTDILSPYASGESLDLRVNEAFDKLKVVMTLPKKPDKGVVVMTEGASGSAQKPKVL